MLPKIDVPIYETTLISTGKTVKFRPFLVKEQKDKKGKRLGKVPKLKGLGSGGVTLGRVKSGVQASIATWV